MNKRAVVFGVTGQDGSYLSELLLEQGYEVVGVRRRASTDNTDRLGNVKGNDSFTLVEGDITDASSVSGIVSQYLNEEGGECYNLAAQSHVGTSFEQPSATFNINAGGVLNILESIRTINPSVRFYQASTSEMFGDSVNEYGYQSEDTEFAPRSPYAVAKMAGHNLVHTYRESYGLHASCGILFNHESERRGENFVTRKITDYVARLDAQIKKHNLTSDDIDEKDAENLCWLPKTYVGNGEKTTWPKLRLGNLKASRDWGHAADYVRAMWLMLQQEHPDDYVIATGETHSVEQLVSVAFGLIGISDWQKYVYIDPQFFRPAEVEFLKGSYSKAKRHFNWSPEIEFEELVERMLKSDMKKYEKEARSPAVAYPQ